MLPVNLCRKLFHLNDEVEKNSMTTLHSCSYSSSVSLGCVTTSLTNLPQQQICFSFLPSLWYSILQLLNPWSADQAKNWEQAIYPCSALKMSCSVYPTIRQFMSQNGVKNIHFNLVDIRNKLHNPVQDCPLGNASGNKSAEGNFPFLKWYSWSGPNPIGPVFMDSSVRVHMSA